MVAAGAERGRCFLTFIVDVSSSRGVLCLSLASVLQVRASGLLLLSGSLVPATLNDSGML